MSGSPFEVLGVPLTATDAEIKAAYRRLVALYHPDNNPGFPVEATEKVREINEAYARARTGWRPTAEAVAGTPRSPHANPPRRWDPPKPPPRPKGPQVPPPKYGDVPPPRSGPPRPRPSEAGAELAARTAALVGDLVQVGFLARTDEAASGHAVLDALLPLFPTGDHLRSCARYEQHQLLAGERPPVGHRGAFMHAVPSLAVGGIRARQEAVDRIVRAEFVACTDDRLLWTVSSFAPGDGIMLREEIDVFAVGFDAIVGRERRRGGIQVLTQGGAALGFRLGRRDAERLETALRGS